MREKELTAPFYIVVTSAGYALRTCQTEAEAKKAAARILKRNDYDGDIYIAKTHLRAVDTTPPATFEAVPDAPAS